MLFTLGKHPIYAKDDTWDSYTAKLELITYNLNISELIFYRKLSK